MCKYIHTYLPINIHSLKQYLGWRSGIVGKGICLAYSEPEPDPLHCMWPPRSPGMISAEPEANPTQCQV